MRPSWMRGASVCPRSDPRQACQICMYQAWARLRCQASLSLPTCPVATPLPTPPFLPNSPQPSVTISTSPPKMACIIQVYETKKRTQSGHTPKALLDLPQQRAAHRLFELGIRPRQLPQAGGAVPVRLQQPGAVPAPSESNQRMRV